ncbi:hypothetical protein ACTXPA_17710 [Glutamicibacter arilaitensis]|uniref:hypothetical protein n=1 Tax=Glutamicibacter arilaitensis TaxID=256701 RepID=UPI003FD215C4
MATVTFTSIGTSPGITTTALALAIEWPRPVILVEADISKPSSVIAGYMQCQISGKRGLSTLAEISAMSSVDRDSILGSCVPLTSSGEDEGTENLLLPAISNPDAGHGVTTMWGELAEELAAFELSGYDTIVDLGRWGGTKDRRVALAERADVMLYGLQPTFSSLAALDHGKKSIEPIRDAVGRGDTSSVVLFQTPVGGSNAREVKMFLNMGVSGEIPFAPKQAAVFSQGVPRSNRRLMRNNYMSSIRSLRAKIFKDLEAARELIKEESDAG